MSESNANKRQQAPAAKAATPPRSAQPPRISLLRGARPARILLLDDECFVRNAIKLMLKFWFKDCRVAECATGDEGLRKIARRPPDLLITDYAHPGPRAEEKLHRLLRTRIRFPILVASGYLGEFPELQKPLLCFSGFTVEFLHKPFLAQDLKAAVLKCLNLVHGR